MDSLRMDAKAIAWVGGVFLLLALVGFTPRYFAPLFSGTYQPPSAWMHLHVLTSLLWLIAFQLQPLLIVNRSFQLHRQLGRIALVVAVLTAVTGFAVQVDLLPVASGDTGNLGAFTARFAGGLGIFVPAVVLAVLYRKRSAWHLRLMYLATMSLMPSPFGRILVHYVGVSLDTAGPLIGLFNLLCAAMLPIYDKLAHGKVERISWFGFAIVALAGLAIGALINNEAWIALLTGQ